MFYKLSSVIENAADVATSPIRNLMEELAGLPEEELRARAAVRLGTGIAMLLDIEDIISYLEDNVDV